MNNRVEKPLQTKWIGYVVTIAVEILITVGLLTLLPYFPLGNYPILYVLLIMAIAYIFGEGPAILAFIMGLVLFTYFFVYPIHFFWPPATTPEGWARLAAFFIGTSIVGFAMILIRRSRRQADEFAKTLGSERDILQIIMESTNAHIAYLDPQMNFVMVNSTYAKGSGRKKEEFIGRNHFELFPNPENQAAFEKARDTGEIIEFKAKPFEFADQSWRGATYWDWTLTPVKDATGRVQGLVLSLVDVTDVVQAKQMGDALNSINAAINSTLDFDEIMRRVVVESAKAIGVESAVIAVHEDEAWAFRYVYGLSQEAVGMRFTDEEVPLNALAAEIKEPVTVNDTFRDNRVNLQIMKKFGVRSFLVVPLLVRDEVIGVIRFQYHSEAVPFSDAQVDFTSKLSASVSLSLENARLFRAEHEATIREAEARITVQRHFELLQRALLPRAPSVDSGYGVAARYIPAYVGQEIGGDFYDVFRTEDGKVGILIGDVSGKGIEAASLAAATRSTIRAFAYELSSAGKALTHANTVIATQLPDIGSFVTVFLLILDLPSGDIIYCSAGHPPATIYRADKSVELLTFGQPPVGLLEKLEYRESRSHIKPGEKLVLYTDGILEARHDTKEMFGTEGIESVLKEHGHLSPDDVVEKILAAATDCAKGRLTDDSAVIVVERKATVGAVS